MCVPITIDMGALDDLDKRPQINVDPAGTGTPAPEVNPLLGKTIGQTITESGGTPGVDGNAPGLVGKTIGDTIVAGGGTLHADASPGGAIGSVGPGDDPTKGAGSTGTKLDTLTPAQQLAASSTNATDLAAQQNRDLITSITDLAHHVTDTTTNILDAQTKATDALKNGFIDLTTQQQAALKAADDLRKNTGQASRKPSYSLSLDANRRSNSTGNSSTMLTGAGGVPTNTLALGRAQLLGGAAA